MRATREPSGQIMPMVALMMVVIIGMAAFAIDGSHIYAQHRRMQASLDVAVKVAAAKMFDFNPSDSVYTSTAQTAIQSAAQVLQQDGYSNNIVGAVYGSSPYMTVSPTGTGLCGVDTQAGIKICTPPITSSSPFYGRYDYVEGFLNPDVYGYFGGVLGLDRVHISVRAVAWHGGAEEPFSIIGLDPNDCSVQVQDRASMLSTSGSIHANGWTCNNGTATSVISGTSESVISSTNPLTGVLGTQNGGAAVIQNPYSPTVPLPMAPAITICSSGCTATGFGDPALNTSQLRWAYGTGSTSCYANLLAVDPSLAISPPSGITYYLPPDAPNPPSSPWGTTAEVSGGFSATGGEYDFLPHCNNSDPSLQIGAIYYFTGSPDIRTDGGPTINSFNSAFVLDPSSGGDLIRANGNSNDQWVLQAPINGPLQGMAIYENQPCFSPPPATPAALTIKLNGNASDQINGIVDAACADLTITGNSNNTQLNGALIAWQVTAAGHGAIVVNYNPPGLPPDKGSVLVE